MGIEYELAPGPWRGGRPEQVEHTGDRKYPAIEFDDGTWYREESKAMEAAIRAGKLDEMHGKTPLSQGRVDAARLFLLRGYSSVGRAPGSHPGGRRFESG